MRDDKNTTDGFATPTTLEGWDAWIDRVHTSGWSNNEKAAALLDAKKKIEATAWTRSRDDARATAERAGNDADHLIDLGADPLSGLEELSARGSVRLAYRT